MALANNNSNKKLTKRQRRVMFEKHLSFQLKYAYESYAKSEAMIEAKLKSEQEREDYWADVILKKRMTVMEHPTTQQYHAKEMILIWKKALHDFKRLQEGLGTKEELETFRMFFIIVDQPPKKKRMKTYHSAEEMPQQKLFSFD